MNRKHKAGGSTDSLQLPRSPDPPSSEGRERRLQSGVFARFTRNGGQRHHDRGLDQIGQTDKQSLQITRSEVQDYTE